MFKDMYAVYGAAGFGREVMALARENLRTNGVATTQLVFVDDNAAVPEINGHRVFRYAEYMAESVERRYVAVAVANSVIREAIVSRCTSDGILPWSLAAANSVALDDVCVGPGSIICPFVTLTSNIRIGAYFHANLYSYVAHDCVVGDYVTFAPAVRCNGNIVIEDHAYIGTGAVLKQGQPGRPLTIGRGAVVGMGAVVTKDVPAGVTVVGNPARVV
jgi:sugar O-acyltransferase (sialic acid O-acetyltransferase NeuD family)